MFRNRLETVLLDCLHSSAHAARCLYTCMVQSCTVMWYTRLCIRVVHLPAHTNPESSIKTWPLTQLSGVSSFLLSIRLSRSSWEDSAHLPLNFHFDTGERTLRWSLSANPLFDQTTLVGTRETVFSYQPDFSVRKTF